MARYIVANWESHATIRTAEQWLRDFYHYYTPNPGVEVIVAPAFVFIHDLRRAIAAHRADRLSLAVQDISPFPFGGYTGAVAAEMVKGLVQYAIVGHSARRRYFHETAQEVANKVSEAVIAGITPILCVDPAYAQVQIAAIEDLGQEKLILAYDPYTGIGVKSAPTAAEAAGAMKQISSLLPSRPILYGGPLRPDNAGEYLRLEGVAGLLVGSASLDPVDFANICQEAARERLPA